MGERNWIFRWKNRVCPGKDILDRTTIAWSQIPIVCTGSISVAISRGHGFHPVGRFGYYGNTRYNRETMLLWVMLFERCCVNTRDCTTASEKWQDDYEGWVETLQQEGFMVYLKRQSLSFLSRMDENQGMYHLEYQVFQLRHEPAFFRIKVSRWITFTR